MGLSDKIQKNTEVPQKKTVELPKKEVVGQSTTSFDLNTDELEFIIRLIGNSNFKGNNLMFIYDLVKKLQDEFLRKSGGK